MFDPIEPILRTKSEGARWKEIQLSTLSWQNTHQRPDGGSGALDAPSAQPEEAVAYAAVTFNNCNFKASRSRIAASRSTSARLS